MNLCIDIGNTHIFGGLYEDNALLFQFRYPSSIPATSDQIGIFLKSVLRENNIDPKIIAKVSIASVVPAFNYSIRAAFLKYFSLEPFFLQIENAGLKIEYKNPHEVGMDRISNGIAATHKYPNKNLIVIDFGTATTFDAISSRNIYLGGVIIPGLYISMKSLPENTSKLAEVSIIKPEMILGQTTTANIQSGLYYSHLGAAREIIEQIKRSIFQDDSPLILGTGGFAYLFEDEQLFTAIIPELVLEGLNIAIGRG